MQKGGSVTKEEGTGKSPSPDLALCKLMYACNLVKKKGCNQVVLFFYLTVHDLQPFGSTQVS